MKYLLVIAALALIIWGGAMQLSGLQKSASQNQGTEQGLGINESLELAGEAKLLLEGGAKPASESTLRGTLDTNRQDTMKDKQLNDEAAGTMLDREGKKPASANTSATQKSMLVAGGCFWCVEADLEKLSGVIEVVSGYAEGTNVNPTYENYSDNGHREVVEVTYNPLVVSFEEILIYAMKHMDPTDRGGSFYDRGENYAPAFYYETEEQKATIDALIAEVDKSGPYDKPLAIAVVERPAFWPAEDYHQDYYKGTLSKLKYLYYRNASGRDDFIKKYWGTNTGPDLPWRSKINGAWRNFTKPPEAELKQSLTAMQYKVTQEDGTEPAFNNAYWDNEEQGIYVDIISGEPLFSSTHKFDSGTGWPSFTRPIDYGMVTEHLDYKLILPRTEIRSAIAHSHLGHLFNDGPKELGGLRYCMNSASLRFVAKGDMEAQGYGDFLYLFEA